MPQVSVTINGRRFRMACENGEEPRLMRLAEDSRRRAMNRGLCRRPSGRGL
jgi:cell division protein ZapA (FtsZ GTPase activity inhibitor)